MDIGHILWFLAGLVALPVTFLIAFLFDDGSGVTDDPVKRETAEALGRALRDKKPNVIPRR